MNLLHCALILGFILGPTTFYGRSNSSGESAVTRDTGTINHNCTGRRLKEMILLHRTPEIWRQRFCFGFLPRISKFVKSCMIAVCSLFLFHLLSFSVRQGYLERSPVFFGFYTRGSLNLPCLNTPLLYLAAISSIFFFSLVMVVRRLVSHSSEKKVCVAIFPYTSSPLLGRRLATSTPGCSGSVSPRMWALRSSAAGTSPSRILLLLFSNAVSSEMTSRWVDGHDAIFLIRNVNWESLQQSI